MSPSEYPTLSPRRRLRVCRNSQSSAPTIVGAGYVLAYARPIYSRARVFIWLAHLTRAVAGTEENSNFSQPIHNAACHLRRWSGRMCKAPLCWRFPSEEDMGPGTWISCRAVQVSRGSFCNRLSSAIHGLHATVTLTMDFGTEPQAAVRMTRHSASRQRRAPS